MKRLIICVFLLTGMAPVCAQNNIPAFKKANIRLYIPAYLTGIMEDAAGSLRNDTLIYNLTGQLFNKDGFTVIKNSRARGLATPWETMIELTDAYIKRDKERVINLYSDANKAEIRSYLNGPEAGEFLDYAAKIANANLKIIGGITYQQGFLVYVRDNTKAVRLNYMVKEGNQYKLSKLDDKRPTSWNIQVYFSYQPGPMIPAKNVALPARLKIDDSVALKIMLPEAGRWVALYMGKPGESVQLLAQDNGLNDHNPVMKQVTIHLPGYIFINPGDYSFYISSFNYPVQRISAAFFTDAKYSITIYE